LGKGTNYLYHTLFGNETYFAFSVYIFRYSLSKNLTIRKKATMIFNTYSHCDPGIELNNACIKACNVHCEKMSLKLFTKKMS
jgi:hypothetical protein